MQYEAYQGKMKRIAGKLAQLYRYKVPIIIALIALALVTAALVAAKGLVVAESKCPAEIRYGDNMAYRAYVFLGRTTYEYRTADSDWTTTRPTIPGEYMVRARGRTAMGGYRYGKEHTYTLIPRDIHITIRDRSVVYGEEPRVSADLAKGDKIDYRLDYADRLSPHTQVWLNAGSIRITDKQTGRDVMSAYRITVDGPSELTIRPRNLTVISGDATKTYDGKLLACTAYEVSKKTPLLDGDFLVAVQNANITDAGTIANTPTLRILQQDHDDVTQFYNIEIRPGTLTVEKRPLILTTGSATKTYSGNGVECPEYEVDASTQLVANHSIVVESAPSLVDCGSVENILRLRIYDSQNGRDVTDNYAIQMHAGTLRVVPHNVTVYTDDQSLVYNGERQTYPSAYLQNGVRGRDQVEFVNAASLTDVGQCPNTMEARFMRDGKDVSANYIVEYVYGTLRVVRRPIEIHLTAATKPYDGTALTSTRFTVKNLVNGHDVEMQTVGSIREPGTGQNYGMEETLTIRDGKTGRDVKENYSWIIFEGTLTITLRPITLTAGTKSWVYDGETHSYNHYEITEGSLLAGHELYTRVHGSATEAGEWPNAFDTANTYIMNQRNNVSRYYEITFEEGMLDIQPRPITISTSSGSWLYDGKKHSTPPNPILDPDTPLLAGHSLRRASETSVSVENAGEWPNACEMRVFNHKDQDVTHNYRINYRYGTLTVTPRPITVITGSTSYEFTGIAQTYPVFWISPDTASMLLSGHALIEDTSEVFLHARTYENQCLVKVREAGTLRDVTGNYEITYRYGTITITPRPIEMTVVAEKVYDGLPFLTAEARVTGQKKLAAGHRAIATFQNTSLVDVCVVNTPLSVRIWDSEGNDVSDDYRYTCNKGKVTITKRYITVQTASASKLYDGEPLTALTAGTSPASLPLAAGHTIHLKVTGEQTDIGRSVNSYEKQTLYITNANGTPVTYNYEIADIVKGILTVYYPFTVRITTPSAEKDYDGRPLTAREYELFITDGTLPDGYTVAVDVLGSITEPGSTSNHAVISVYNEFGTNITDLVDVRSRFGTLTVNKPVDPGVYVAGQVMSEADVLLYLRGQSYGDYNGHAWTDAPEYPGLLDGIYSYNYLPAILLRQLGASWQQLQFSDMAEALIPYYAWPNGSGLVAGSDVLPPVLSGRDYRIPFYPITVDRTWLDQYAFITPDQLTALWGDYADEEQAYRQFVHEQYLFIDDETADFMWEIIRQEGFDTGDLGTIFDVAAYIQKAASYNLNYDSLLDQADNVAIAFLRDYREGVCTHYATAATLLYRALGYPARYVTGYMVEAKAGQWTEITAPGHAWVEVYVDGIGWIQMEVTGSDSAGGGGGSGGGDNAPIQLEITPSFGYKIYDGVPLYPSNELVLTPELAALLAAGYTYDVVISGEQYTAGCSDTEIVSFVLYDPKGKDVTADFAITFRPGLLCVTGESVRVIPYQLHKVYDGISLTYGAEDFEILSVPEGVEVSFRWKIAMTDVFMLTLSDLNRNLSEYLEYHLYRDGRDVTADYPLVLVFPEGMAEVPVATVAPRTIELTAASVTAQYAGEPLENRGIRISKGSLAEGHILLAEATGICTGVGTVENPVGMVLIRDEQGRDVTDNYRIERVSGILTLLGEEDIP